MIYHFLMSNVIISFFIILIALLRHFMHIPPKYGRLMWIMCLFLMAAVFIPHIDISLPTSAGISRHMTASGFVAAPSGSELYVSSYSLDFVYYIWLIGVFAGFILLFSAVLMLIFMPKTPVKSDVFEALCAKLDVKASLFISSNIGSPVSFGILSPKVVLPERDYSAEALEFIYIHELYHHKNRDMFINLIMNIMSVIFWFNPFVHIMSGLLRLDTEMYCDDCVRLESGDSIAYGRTLLRMAEHRQGFMTEHFSDRAKLKRRLEAISEPRSNDCKKYRPLLFFTAFVIFCAGISINAHGGVISRVSLPAGCENIELDGYFGDKKGCFVLFDSSDKNYYIYNAAEAVRRSSPDSTYKIAIALNALENNVISAESNTLGSHEEEYPFPEWYGRHDLSSAMLNSVNWYFQTLDANISDRARRNFLNNTSYGNRITGWSKKSYWLENSLEISPLEQTNFIKGVYYNSFDFDENSVNTVLNAINLGDGLYGKTGTGNVRGKNIRGWFVGIAELSDRTLFFALEMTGEGADGITARSTALNILNDKFIK